MRPNLVSLFDKKSHLIPITQLTIVQELNHMRAAAVLMTFVMVVSVLTSIAIIRRIIMATSVLKASTILYMYKWEKELMLIICSNIINLRVLILRII